MAIDSVKLYEQIAKKEKIKFDLYNRGILHFYFNKKHQGYLTALLKVLPKLSSSIIKYLFFSLFNKREKKEIYFHRFSGLINSIFGRQSWYRPKL